MGSCAAPSAKGDDKFITTDYLQQCPAKYTIQYKQAVEQKCNTALSVEQLNSKAFTNVVQAMVSSETVDRMGLDAAGGSLQDTLSVIGKNVTCSDLNAPFKALLDDKDFTRKHQHLSKVLHTWNEVVSQSKP
ncbi:hypothetical protein BZ828_21475 [Salmonella enterica subsp. enterica serovar Enteritidis]|nr:hypothetical protein [Salmonella enterica subsp. enterica serovar Enteritidis]EBX8947225.1 hypothetical protein [Salmonella enterica subsp. enterica serovar Enteritidis]EBX9064927.1 hypothetical protein [Salmonella enterica subsp. enterica serovar Enteritidis]EBY6971502.1 hypothetical protein [Salmonella enterica subsp. enterica serovar Enteritidis]ECD5397027.1 hypothetical protein [Salmonella enterica subsp. enterica serovar Enteritidis]